MKNLDKIITNILILTWVVLSCTTLKAEVVITEFFILQADNSHAPQYVELYNNSNSTISLENWSITTLYGDGELISKSPFNDPLYVQANNMEIAPFGYFLISSSFCDYSIIGCNFYNEYQSDIIAFYLYLPLDGRGSIILKDNTNNIIDSVGYNIEDSWEVPNCDYFLGNMFTSLACVVGEEYRGHSLRLHSPELDNSLHENWSLSPDTENSLWLYEENSESRNFGSPREENSFQLQNIRYSDVWFSNIEIDTGGTHIIYGDYNNFYKAEPFVDNNENGIWDNDEEFDDRNDNDYWDSQNNNYGEPLEFSWVGTSIENTPALTDLKYEIIVEKDGAPISNSSWLNITDTTIPVLPLDLLIDSLGRYREIAEYTWTIELTKTYSDSVDIIYSDKYTFSIDASDYGRYGCVDNGCCTDDSDEVDENGICPILCSTNAYYEIPYKSNHPIECTPGVDCFSALNYYEDANISSSTCHYVSLSIPAFVVGNTNTIARVPVYFKNDSLAEINEIEFTLNYDYSSDIVSYEEGTILGTVVSELGDGNIVADQNGNISVNMSLLSARIAGIITYLDFNLIGLQGDSDTTLTISIAQVKGGFPENWGFPENDISVPVRGGELVILQTDYEISGNITYYPGDNSWEIPNVELRLDKNYEGDSSEITNESGFFKFDLLTEGNYNLSFSKSPENDCNDDAIKGTDISLIAHYAIGSVPFNADQFIAADVSLNGTVSGYDASLAAQYSVDLIDNFNYLNTHWIFKPLNQETLPNVHAELLNQTGQYSIEYKPLVLDDKNRKISAYRLGDVYGDYCKNPLSRFNSGQVQFTNIAIDYVSVITFPIIISEPTFIEGMDIEIGYDADVFSPHSITFNTSNIKTEKYNSVSNLLSREGSIKTVTWAIDEPQIVEGIIGEVSFNWNNKNKSGKIWLKKFQINDEPAVGGISIIGLSENDVTDGVNIINSLVPVELSLHQNYPNPFNPQTTIKWSMPLSGIASLEVYNLQGQLVELLFNGQLDTGIHEQEWDATAYPSGIYFYRLKTHEKTLQKIMLLLK